MTHLPTRVLLVRHGQSTWNALGKWQGQADPPLSPLGVLQAEAAARELAAEPAFATVIASDLVRAVHTASILADGLGLPTPVLDERLRESDAGEWTGLTRVEIDAGWPGWVGEGKRPPHFEAAAHVAGRARRVLVDAHRRHPGVTVLGVAHSGVIRCLESSLGERAPVPANLGGRWFIVGPDGLEVGDTVLLIDPATITVTVPQQP